jgi:hypothetical protein
LKKATALDKANLKENKANLKEKTCTMLAVSWIERVPKRRLTVQEMSNNKLRKQPPMIEVVTRIFVMQMDLWQPLLMFLH